jgi:integrase/recombinase XerC
VAIGKSLGMVVFGGVLSEYLADQRRRNLSPGTIELRRLHICRFAEWLAASGGDWRSATPAQVNAWLDGKRRIAPRTRYNWLSNLHSFYKWAQRHGHVEHDPTIDIDRPKLPRLLPRPIDDGDLAMALELAEPTMRAWLLLMATCGLRCGEVAGLAKADLMWSEGMIRVYGKGSRERIVPLHPAAADALRILHLPSRGPAFRRPMGGPASGTWISQEVGFFLRTIGLEASAHQLRHFFGTSAYRASKDLRLTQELMGHASPTTTAGYAAFSRGDMAQVVASIRVPGAERHHVA